MVPQRPAFAVSLTPAAPARRGSFGAESLCSPLPPQHSPLVSPWGGQRHGENADGAASSWPGFDIFALPPTPSLAGQYAWSTDQQTLSMAITACEEGCTSHSDEVHNAIQTLKAYGSVQGHWTTASNWGQEHSAWTLVPAVPPEPGTLSWPIEVPGQGLGRMPAPQVMQNEELLAVCKSTRLLPTSFPSPSCRPTDYWFCRSCQLSITIHRLAGWKARRLKSVHQMLRSILHQLTAAGTCRHLFRGVLPHRHRPCRENSCHGPQRACNQASERTHPITTLAKR